MDGRSRLNRYQNLRNGLANESQDSNSTNTTNNGGYTYRSRSGNTYPSFNSAYNRPSTTSSYVTNTIAETDYDKLLKEHEEFLKSLDEQFGKLEDDSFLTYPTDAVSNATDPEYSTAKLDLPSIEEAINAIDEAVTTQEEVKEEKYEYKPLFGDTLTFKPNVAIPEVKKAVTPVVTLTEVLNEALDILPEVEEVHPEEQVEMPAEVEETTTQQPENNVAEITEVFEQIESASSVEPEQVEQLIEEDVAVEPETVEEELTVQEVLVEEPKATVEETSVREEIIHVTEAPNVVEDFEDKLVAPAVDTKSVFAKRPTTKPGSMLTTYSAKKVVKKISVKPVVSEQEEQQTVVQENIDHIVLGPVETVNEVKEELVNEPSLVEEVVETPVVVEDITTLEPTEDLVVDAVASEPAEQEVVSEYKPIIPEVATLASGILTATKVEDLAEVVVGDENPSVFVEDTLEYADQQEESVTEEVVSETTESEVVEESHEESDEETPVCEEESVEQVAESVDENTLIEEPVVEEETVEEIADTVEVVTEEATEETTEPEEVLTQEQPVMVDEDIQLVEANEDDEEEVVGTPAVPEISLVYGPNYGAENYVSREEIISAVVEAAEEQEELDLSEVIVIDDNDIDNLYTSVDDEENESLDETAQTEEVVQPANDETSEPEVTEEPTLEDTVNEEPTEETSVCEEESVEQVTETVDEDTTVCEPVVEEELTVEEPTEEQTTVEDTTSCKEETTEPEEVVEETTETVEVETEEQTTEELVSTVEENIDGENVQQLFFNLEDEVVEEVSPVIEETVEDDPSKVIEEEPVLFFDLDEETSEEELPTEETVEEPTIEEVVEEITEPETVEELSVEETIQAEEVTVEEVTAEETNETVEETTNEETAEVEEDVQPEVVEVEVVEQTPVEEKKELTIDEIVDSILAGNQDTDYISDMMDTFSNTTNDEASFDSMIGAAKEVVVEDDPIIEVIEENPHTFEYIDDILENINHKDDTVEETVMSDYFTSESVDKDVEDITQIISGWNLDDYSFTTEETVEEPEQTISQTPVYKPMEEIDAPVYVDSPSQVAELSRKLETERVLREQMLEKTKEINLKVSEYETELNDVNSSMTKTNKILNFVLTLLIITLFIILFVIGFWFAQERGII